MNGMPQHQYHMEHVGSEEPQTPTHHIQMSFEDAIEAANHGYPAQTPNTCIPQHASVKLRFDYCTHTHC